MKIIDYAGGMKLIYHDNHDARYAHIPERFRWEYPDEIKLQYSSPIKRTKPLREVTLEEAFQHGVRPHLLANDTPFTEGCIKA